MGETTARLMLGPSPPPAPAVAPTANPPSAGPSILRILFGLLALVVAAWVFFSLSEASALDGMSAVLKFFSLVFVAIGIYAIVDGAQGSKA